MQIKNKNYKINYVEQKYSKEDAYKTLDIINMWIGNVDSKISYSLTFIGVLLGFFITTSKPINISQVVDKIIKKIGQISRDGIHTSLNSIELKEIISVIILILIFIFIITASVACIYLYKGIKGRIDSDIYNQDRVVIKSNIFWDSISNQQYNSKICTEKFKNYNKGVDYIVISVIIFFMYTIIGYIFI